MKDALKIFLSLALVAGLCGCKQTQLGGSVTNADIRVDLLNQPGAGYQNVKSSDSGDAIGVLGLANWYDLNDIQKSIWLGGFTLDERLVEPDRLYLVTARGGFDIDANHDGRIDLDSTEVRGTWHAIMRGDSLLGLGNHVSALTEAAYQHARERIGYIGDDELLALLDDFAATVVLDVNSDRRVDYADLLLWSRSLSAARYKGTISLLDLLATAIRDREPDYVIEAAAESVYRNMPVEAIPPLEPVATELSGNFAGDKVLTLAQSPYVLVGRLTVQGDLRIEPGVVVTSGPGRSIDVYGNLQVEGLPRQRVVLQGVSLTLYSSRVGATSVLRNANVLGGRLDFKVQKLLVEQNTLDSVYLVVSNIVASADSAVDIRGNTLAASTVMFDNSAPKHPAFMVSFRNNAISPVNGGLTTLISRWDSSVENLVVRDNTFNANIQVLRDSTGAKMDISYNYWGPRGFPLDMIDTVIPDNAGQLGFPIIRYEPILLVAHPDTPVAQ